MAESSSTTSPPDTSTSNGISTKKKGGLLTFIKKNKTLSGVVGGVGVYLLYKMNKEKSGESTSTEPEGEVNAIAGEGGAAAGTAEAAAFELGRAERLAEGSHNEVEEIEAEREEERARHKEEIRGKEVEEEGEGNEPNPTSPASPPEGPAGAEPPATGSESPSVNIHGRNFPGASSSHIAKTGQTEGGKKYVEYAIQFPGKVEHWQYFTGTGNWRQVSGSDTGGGANKPGPGNNPKPNTPPAGGPATNPKGTPARKPKVGIGPAKPVAPPAAPPVPTPVAHPQAVDTGNPCVKGGIGGHTAPPGYHLFCGSNGHIWRAPNS
jgi:hypothetical protein